VNVVSVAGCDPEAIVVGDRRAGAIQVSAALGSGRGWLELRWNRARPPSSYELI
jgi:hypothetical protein